MPLVVGIRFKSSGKVYYFDPMDYSLNLQDIVIVDTVRGQEVGYVAQIPMQLPEEKVTTPLRKVLRLATENDRTKAEENHRRAQEAIGKAMEKVVLHGLDMRIVDAEYAFDLSKVIFFFTSEGRVDFRDLVKDLASIFRTRVELRQIGVRDKAKMVGGLGCCGRSLCCATFLADFEPVSIKMAKEQNLSLNPLKISGVCGRLMCCLKYENDVYKERNREAKAAAKMAQASLKEGEPGGTSCENCSCPMKKSLELKKESSQEEKPRSEMRNGPREPKRSEKAESSFGQKPTENRKKPAFNPRKKETTKPLDMESPPNENGFSEEVGEKRKRSRVRAPRKEKNEEIKKTGNGAVLPIALDEKEHIMVQKPERGTVRFDNKKRRNDTRKRIHLDSEKMEMPKKKEAVKNEGIRVGMRVITPEGAGKVINLRAEDRQATVFLENKSILEFSFHLLKRE